MPTYACVHIHKPTSNTCTHKYITARAHMRPHSHSTYIYIKITCTRSEFVHMHSTSAAAHREARRDAAPQSLSDVIFARHDQTGQPGVANTLKPLRPSQQIPSSIFADTARTTLSLSTRHTPNCSRKLHAACPPTCPSTPFSMPVSYLAQP